MLPLVEIHYIFHRLHFLYYLCYSIRQRTNLTVIIRHFGCGCVAVSRSNLLQKVCFSVGANLVQILTAYNKGSIDNSLT